jgi:ribose 5-phosphate isomerase B
MQNIITHIYIGCDHAAVELKNSVVGYIKHQFPAMCVVDMGVDTTDSVDYPNIAVAVCERLLATDHLSNSVGNNFANNLGILLCGTGIGMSIAANKYHANIRAGLVHSVETAEKSKDHNNANCLCLGARVLDTETALDIVGVWLNTPFSQDTKHARRVDLFTHLYGKQ